MSATGEQPLTAGRFDDLLAANRTFAESFALQGFDGVAQAGIGVVTCMDSRIDPLGMLGLHAGDAKFVRNPGGRVDESAIEAMILGVHLLNVDRILIIPHTRCAMSSKTEFEFRDAVTASGGVDAHWQHFHAVDDQLAALRDDVLRLRAHPLIPDSVVVGGFRYDVDTGLIEHIL